MLYAIGIVFAFCELCQRVTDAFAEIADELKMLDWYRFPQEIQRMLPIILLGIEQPVFIECFGSISGLRETFKKVN